MPLFADTIQNPDNPALGVMIFVIGGLAGAIFYLPFKKVTNWAWESYWMVYAVIGLVVVPWILAFSTSPNVITVLAASPLKQVVYCFLCGAMWGLGGLTWGLMIRYLGVGLGLALGCGLCSAAGTLIPPILNEMFPAMFVGQKDTFTSLLQTSAGKVSLGGVIVSLFGIILVGIAGMSKENELPEEQKKIAVAEYNFKKGIMVAIFSGLMSAAMNFGLNGGPELQNLALVTEPATTNTWKGMPVLVVVLSGGFVVNACWCLYLNLKNKTIGDYTKSSSPIIGNLFFAAVAGTIWCSQFICFKTGESAMGKLGYIGWAVLMASAILFSTLLGIFLGEWKNTSSRTKTLLASGLLLLVLSSIVSGVSGYMK